MDLTWDPTETTRLASSLKFGVFEGFKVLETEKEKLEMS